MNPGVLAHILRSSYSRKRAVFALVLAVVLVVLVSWGAAVFSPTQLIYQPGDAPRNLLMLQQSVLLTDRSYPEPIPEGWPAEATAARRLNGVGLTHYDHSGGYAPTGRAHMRTEWRSGWPFRAMLSREWTYQEILPATNPAAPSASQPPARVANYFASQPPFTALKRGISIQSLPPSVGGKLPGYADYWGLTPRRIPLLPLVFGFAANTALYFAAIYAFWPLRHIYRRGRGLCTSCGFDRAGLNAYAPCPECGFAPLARTVKA